MVIEMPRTRYNIYADILTLTKIRAKKTHIVYRCNLNFNLVNDCLKDLINRGMLIIVEHNKRVEYETTEKGLEYLALFENVDTLMPRSPLFL